MSRNNSFDEKRKKSSVSGGGRPSSANKHDNDKDHDHSEHSDPDHSTSSIKTGTDFSSKYSEKSEDEDFGESAKLTGNESFAERMNIFLKRQGKAFIRNFIDYGPPYSKKPFDVAMINECAKPVLNHFELHKLLNTRLDPNIPDAEDLYYTCIHWCARNAHYLGIKMLRRAGARVNVTNEMGVTPLDLAVMIKHPRDKRKEKIKVIKYLLENGANPNNRDKGGFSAIDHAAANQDLEVIKMLLEYGANVMRENYVFVGSRHHILKKVHDPECYKVLYEKLMDEESEAFAKQIKTQNRNFLIESEKNHEKLHNSLNKKKQRRLERLKSLEDTKRQEEVMGTRLTKLRDEMEKNLRANNSKKESYGIWTKDVGEHWEFQPQKFAPITSQGIYDDNKKIMSALRDKNSVTSYNKVWRQQTDGGRIELRWTRADPFKLPDDDDDRSRVATPFESMSLKSIGEMSSNVDYRDENDQELEGEDLDDIINNLQAL